MQIIGGKINPVKTISSYAPTFLSQTHGTLFQETVAEYGNPMYEAIQRGRLRKKAAGKAREFEESAQRILRNEAYYYVHRNKPAPAKAGEG
jgi:hypothetical protein